MNVSLPPAERTQLRQWQKQRRDNDGYVKVTVVLMLDAGRPATTVAETLGLDEVTVYRYACAFAEARSLPLICRPSYCRQSRQTT